MMPKEQIKKLILMHKQELENSLERSKILFDAIETFLMLVENPVEKKEIEELDDVPIFENQIYLDDIDFEEKKPVEIASNEKSNSTN